MQINFFGFDDSQQTQHRTGFQYIPTYSLGEEGSNYLSYVAPSEVQLEPFSQFTNRSSQFVTFAPNFFADFTFTMSRGSGSMRRPLYSITFDSNSGLLSYETLATYVISLEVVRASGKLYVICNIENPSISQYAVENFYFSCNVDMDIESLSFYQVGCYINTLMPFGRVNNKIISECFNNVPDISGPFEFPTFVDDGITINCIPWDTWGQTNITFDYMQSCYPNGASFDDIDSEPIYWYYWGQQDITFGYMNTNYPSMELYEFYIGELGALTWGRQDVTFAYLDTYYPDLTFQDT